jgi:heptosyltransferase-2
MSLIDLKPEKILIRSTNWIGDAIMTTPAVRTIRRNFPEARIAILAYPWVADVFRASPDVDEVLLFNRDTEHRNGLGLWRLARQLAHRDFDLAILLQNAFKAALLAWLARIPVRAGYSRDGRRPLLTNPVTIRPEIKEQHQVYYYQDLCRQLGLECGPDELFLRVAPETDKWARAFLADFQGRPVIGINPGAAYGPAKCWPVERYGALAARLSREFNAVLPVFGTAADNRTAEAIRRFAPEHVIDLAGRTSLAEAMALIGLCDGFVTNDSGLMHVAAASRTPLVAIFGSTDPVATGPFSERAIVVRKELDCQPCLRPRCRADFRCMTDITVEDVLAAVRELLAQKGGRNDDKR